LAGSGTSEFVVHVPCAPTEPVVTVFCATLTPPFIKIVAEPD
jgi:hypothetical protein